MGVDRKDTVGKIAVLLLIIDLVISIISNLIKNIGNGETNILLNIIISVVSVLIPILFIVIRNKNKTLFIICNVLLTCELIAVILIPLTYLSKVPDLIGLSLQIFIEVVVMGWFNSALTIIGLLMVIIDAVKQLRKGN